MAAQAGCHDDGLVSIAARPVGTAAGPNRVEGPRLLAPVAVTVRRILSGSPDGATAVNRAIARPQGAPGWFGPDSAAWQVHGSVSTFLGGIRALLLQTLHPLALAGVDGHSRYREDPFGRLHRTGAFIAATTFGSAAQAQHTVDAITGMHRRVSGVAADGRTYAATDPALLTWVHIALVDSMMAAYLDYGTNGRLDADCYVADMAVVGSAMGVPEPPRTRAELEATFASFLPDLTGSAHADEVRRFVLRPPLSAPARAGYTVLARAAEDSLQGWARAMLASPRRSRATRAANRAAARSLLSTLQVALVESPARAAARERLGVPLDDMTQLKARRSTSAPVSGGRYRGSRAEPRPHTPAVAGRSWSPGLGSSPATERSTRGAGRERTGR